MIIPEFWAESRLQHRAKKRQVTIRRFGWSNTSEAEAQANADTRANEALQRVLSGEKLLRREPKMAYNGAEGVPIREEIVERRGDTVITRNGYGARCLNTPNVLFIDIDELHKPTRALVISVFLVLTIIAIVASLATHSIAVGVVLGFVFLIMCKLVASLLQNTMQQLSGGWEANARKRVRKFLAQHPAWHARLYRTPAGLRVLVTHQTFNPTDKLVQDCFETLGADPMYAKMCANQQCFRARVSAKPWRAGIAEHIRPNPGVWPVAPERLPQRDAWVARYEVAAKLFAACQFIESIGSGKIHLDVMPVQEWHDDLCAANSKLPLA